MNTNTLPAGAFFIASDLATYIDTTFGSEVSKKFNKAKWPLSYRIDNSIYIQDVYILNWFNKTFNNKTTHPTTKNWSSPRTFAHQLYVEMQCQVSTYFQIKK
jgi:hypothetical protein